MGLAEEVGRGAVVGSQRGLGQAYDGLQVAEFEGQKVEVAWTSAHLVA